MKSYDDLQKEFDKKVKELQEKCPHKKTEYMEQWWAYAHSTGNIVKSCLNCNKTLETKPMPEDWDFKKYNPDWKKNQRVK
jgi:hypothetical protein